MENIEQNKEMTAQQSLNIISQMINDSRRTILQSSAKHFMLWGGLLIVVSLLIFWLWQSSGNPIWNVAWFVMPALGFPMVRILERKETDVPQNKINMNIGLIWLTYCIFAVLISVIAMLWVPMNISLIIVVLVGFAECISGFLLKNWAITISGFIIGIGGAVMASALLGAEQLLIFTVCGIMLVVTGLIIKSQYK
ncbi:MAG: hypothetical protein J6X10_02260 [Bacteroidales bacterium]|nr:hypothetical protein [Bacteroidales bacterium]